MARQGIGTGSSANDGSGDNLRAAGGKINDNFTELYEYFGDGSTLSNGRWDVVSSGINTLSSVGIGTTNPRFTLEVGAVGASGTSLYVNGDARVTGILTVGSSSVTLNGSTNEIIVGTGITINGNTGIISATSFSGGGITTSRVNVSAATGSIGSGATTNLSITAYKSYGLLKVGISSAAWVRLYVDAASRTSDASRSYLADPAAGSGLIAEVRTETAGISTFLMTPGVIGWNNDVSVGSTVYAAVTNNESSAATITVTLSVVKMED